MSFAEYEDEGVGSMSWRNGTSQTCLGSLCEGGWTDFDWSSQHRNPSDGE